VGLITLVNVNTFLKSTDKGGSQYDIVEPKMVQCYPFKEQSVS